MSGYGWPIAFVILGIVFMWKFHPQIADLLAKTKKLGPQGLETYDIQAIQRRQDTGLAEAERQALEDLRRTQDNRLVVEQEDLIKRDLGARGIMSSEAREQALLRAYAATMCLLRFEHVNNLLWASQVAALRFLNVRGVTVKIDELRPIYEEAKAAFPRLFENREFTDWFGFLDQWKLVATGAEDHVGISLFGQEYLKYLVATRRHGPVFG
jgi:hypothetical protein